MKTQREYKDFVIDISNSITDIEKFVKDSNYDSFISNKEKVYAVVYSLLIIGEAVKNIPEQIKEQHTEIPWQKIAGMRNRLIHGYFTVDFEKVWETVNRDLPSLKDAITKILAKL